MKYKLELRIKKFIDPELLDEIIRKPLSKRLKGIGSISIVIPEYQFFQPSDGNLLKINIQGKVLYFKFIKVSISLLNLSYGIEIIRTFVKEIEIRKSSELLFRDEKYDLLEFDFQFKSTQKKSR